MRNKLNFKFNNKPKPCSKVTATYNKNENDNPKKWDII